MLRGRDLCFRSEFGQLARAQMWVRDQFSSGEGAKLSTPLDVVGKGRREVPGSTRHLQNTVAEAVISSMDFAFAQFEAEFCQLSQPFSVGEQVRG